MTSLLTLGKPAPLTLEAFKSRIGIKAAAPHCATLAASGPVPSGPQPPDSVPPLSKTAARRAAHKHVLAVRARAWACKPFPLTEIQGEPVAGDFEVPDIGRIRQWQIKAATELALNFPGCEDDALIFAFRHGLTIAAAFHARKARADVVAALARIFAVSSGAGVAGPHEEAPREANDEAKLFEEDQCPIV